MTMKFEVPLRKLLINGQWVDGASTAVVLNKYTQQPCAHVALPSQEQAKQAVAAAAQAFAENKLTAYDRGIILERAAAIMERRREEITQTVIEEVGFPRQDAVGELLRCIETFRLCAQEARRLHGEVVPLEGAAGQAGRLGFTIRVPLGVICAITPFNAPLNTVAHKVGPAIAAGNAVVLKPSMHTPTPSVFMAQALLEAGLPPGLISIVHGDADVAQLLLEAPQVSFYAFTGSTEVGRKIQERAGLRRTQMELGSIAFTILADDADLDEALPRVVNAAYRKAGQVCTSIQNLLVHRSIITEVERRLAEQVSKLKYGDPAEEGTVVGPVISMAAAERIEQWIKESVKRGARCLVGGSRDNAVIAPTLLANVSTDMPVNCQEIFGPVMSLIPFDDLDDAINQVNATPYGLATGLFTNRLDDAFTAARLLQVGGVHINETSSSRVDLMPYGGSKNSGFGREGPAYTIHEMTEERIITIRVPNRNH
jgi:acyl-CoA reductase-like NAD-dependent aldehyde dehydrogenase